MGPQELKIACQLENIRLIPQIFKGVVDYEACTAAMQAILKVNSRMNAATDEPQLKLMERAFNEVQVNVQQMALPTIENLMRRTPHYAIPLLQSMS